MGKIFISTVPFGEVDPAPVTMLDKSGYTYVINPLNRKLTPQEVGEMAKECDGLIAGTEDINIVLQKAENLKIISRVGVGLDSVPLAECKKRNIRVCYTPDAVTMAVAEFTIGLMLCGTRHIVAAHLNSRKREWKRLQGRRLGGSVIGLIGFGRIGSTVCRLVKEFSPREILVDDVKDKRDEIFGLSQGRDIRIRQVTKEEIYKTADVISLHLPLSDKTRHMISQREIESFKPGAMLVNVSRGGVVKEYDLYEAVKEGRLLAAMDVFEQEPYTGMLSELDNIILTSHMGSCSYDCRARMEIEATEEVIRFFRGESLRNEVPPEEYDYQRSV